MSQQPGPAKEDSAFLASIIQWQFLAISADGRGFAGILGKWSLAILADGREFIGTLGRWSRVPRHMVLDFSAYGPGFLDNWPRICQYSWQIVQNFSAKLAKNLSVFLVDGPGFVSKWPRISWHFGQIAQQAFLVKLTETVGS